MRFAFDLDHVHYVVEFTEQHEFLLHVDAVHSGKAVYQMSSFERGFWDEPPDAVWTTTGAGHVFEVKRHVEDFIDKVLRHHQPYYFTYGANGNGEHVFHGSSSPACRKLALIRPHESCDTAVVAPLQSPRKQGMRTLDRIAKVLSTKASKLVALAEEAEAKMSPRRGR